jgi:twitching motility protein PilT
VAIDVVQLLSFTVKNNGSDLHLSSGVPPMIRVDGDIKRINMPALTHKDVNSMVYDIMNDKQRKDYEEFLETDFSFEIPKLARFRANVLNKTVVLLRYLETSRQKFYRSKIWVRRGYSRISRCTLAGSYW